VKIRVIRGDKNYDVVYKYYFKQLFSASWLNLQRKYKNKKREAELPLNI
jgi:hypothetical protein